MSALALFALPVLAQDSTATELTSRHYEVQFASGAGVAETEVRDLIANPFGNGVVARTADALLELEDGSWKPTPLGEDEILLALSSTTRWSLLPSEVGFALLATPRDAEPSTDPEEGELPIVGQFRRAPLYAEPIHDAQGGEWLLLLAMTGVLVMSPDLEAEPNLVTAGFTRGRVGFTASLARREDGTILLIARDGISSVDLEHDGETWKLQGGDVSIEVPGALSSALRPGVTKSVIDRDGRLWIVTPSVVARYDERAADDADAGWNVWSNDGTIPYLGATSIATTPQGDTWIGTPKGLLLARDESFRVRKGGGWLPSDHVHDVASDVEGVVTVATAAGIVRLVPETLTLSQKAAHFSAEIDRYHRRTPYEYVDGVHLETTGDKSTSTQRSSDNDGLWTSMYGAAECFAFAATGSDEARARARKAFEALAFLSEVTQGGSHPAPHGFPARSILPTSGPDPNVGLEERDVSRRENIDGSWKLLAPRWPTSEDGQWYWKTDTSSDELDGHYFFYAIYHDLVAQNDAERAEVAAVVKRITDHLLAHDYTLVDHDGKPTRWAQFGPRQLNDDPLWWEERGLNSMSVLAYLRIAEHVTGDGKYGDAARELIEDHAYAANARQPKVHLGPGTGNQSDDEMAFMGLYHLTRYEKDPLLRSLWAHTFHRYWQLLAPERNPLFNFLYAAAVADIEYKDNYDDGPLLAPQEAWLPDALETLRDFPLDRIDWRLDHSDRLDIVHLAGSTPEEPRGHLRNLKVLPIDERHVGHWNHDPWDLIQGGSGHRMADGAAFLLPYYLGLYHGFVPSSDEPGGDGQ